MNITSQKSSAELRGELEAQRGKARGIIAGLFDEGTFAELGAYRRRSADECGNDSDFESVVTGYGAVDGRLVFAFVQDFGNRKGAMSAAHADKICALYDKAISSGAAVIGVFDSAGASVLEGAGVLDGYARIMKKVCDAKGMIPQVAVVPGVCAGASAVIASMFDFTVADSEKASLFVTPPFLCGGKGGSAAEAEKRGEVQLTASGDTELIGMTKKLLNFIPSNCSEGTVTALSDSELNRRTYNIDSLTSGAYDVSSVIKELSDDGEFFELSAGYAPEVKTGFAQIGSAVTGVVATSPDVNGGALTCCGAEKAARFIRFCSAFSIPLLTLVDSEGTELKGDAYAKSYAELASAYADCASRTVTVVTGKAYGSVFALLGAGALGTGVVFALDRAEIGVMSPEAAVEFAKNEKIKNSGSPENERKKLIDEWKASMSSPLAAARRGAVDDIIASDELRMRIVSAFELGM